MSPTPSDLQELEAELRAIQGEWRRKMTLAAMGSDPTRVSAIDDEMLEAILAKVRGLVEAEVQAIPEVEIFIADDGNHVDTSLRHHSHAVTAHKTNRLAKLQAKEGGERSE